jgi:hypothetical protein
MHWLNYAFFGLIFALGAAVFLLLRRAKTRRAWVWALVALVGAGGLVALATGRYEPGWRGFAMGLVFDLFAADHFVQYVQSRRAGAPKPLMLVLAGGWLLLGLLQTLWVTGTAS